MTIILSVICSKVKARVKRNTRRIYVSPRGALSLACCISSWPQIAPRWNWCSTVGRSEFAMLDDISTGADRPGYRSSA